ncbi:arsenate reductase (glutaredoxin) [Asticcacaulis sp. BYS171W]|uniref:Arsenate reductase n=1 Tax=Asticcacaulis aquaticus TaxID=2984212 RepID=A0ABT5HNV3_9CAUL|nr:arsenate reductase (glutaredoxin) [Asticcacaulis aquaticus]MDC7681748.1 arsenate reductase (glutaredoxin) [Asticcacaulis aquaticus]
MSVTIYHNPDCGTSRNVLALLEAAGFTPVVVEYLQTGWQREQLVSLLVAAGLTPRTALRESKSPAKEMGLLDLAVSDERLLLAMLEYPVLVNRPIVVTDKGTKLCRPSETVLDLIERFPAGPFYKEDGELLIDANGNRVG